MRSHLRSPRAGFTLIELLTVIAIIGILAAIIIPTVGKVRSAARASHSLSNMRQITPAFLAYAADNRGLIPRAAHGEGSNPAANPLVNPTKGFWYHELTPYVGGTLQLLADGTLSSPRNAPPARFFSCPVWTSLLGFDPIQHGIDTNAADIRIGYSMNGQMAYANGEDVGMWVAPGRGSTREDRTRLDKYKTPSRTVVIAMGMYEAFQVNKTTGAESPGSFSPIDGGGATVEHFRRLGAGSNGLGGNAGGFGFLDGSVRRLTPAEAAVYLRLQN